jgi:hypothetical protein
LRPPLACGNPSSISSRGELVLLAPRRQRRGIAGGVLPQVGDGDAQALDQHIEDLFQQGAMGLLAQDVLEPRDIPGLGHALFRLDADEPAQSLVAAQLGEDRFGADVPQGDPQHDHPPEHMHGVVVAPLAPSEAERVE